MSSVVCPGEEKFLATGRSACGLKIAVDQGVF